MFKTTQRNLIAGLLSAVMVMFSGTVWAEFWSTYTSEEYPPLTSYEPNLIDALWCSGSYCDKLYIRNESNGSNYGNNYWSSYFSEEGTNYRRCSSNQFMTGVACKGRYCDNVSIQCTRVLNKTKGYCHWTPMFSEEHGGMYLSTGYYAAGLQCFGSYCDNKRIWACQAS